MMELHLSEPLEGLEDQARAFLFDCDGTLVDTMGAHHRSWEKTLSSVHGAGQLDYDRFCSLGGMSGVEVAAEIIRWFNLNEDPEDLAMRKRSCFLEMPEVAPPIRPVVELAERVHRSHPVAVVSGGHRPAVERTLEGVGIRGWFDVIVTPEDVEHGKPAPDMYLLAAERLGVAPEQCLVLEDGPPGVQAALSAGMNVVAVGHAADQALRELGPRYRNGAIH